VECFVDGGSSWQEAKYLNRGQPDGDKTWHWVLWELDRWSRPCELVVKAVDEAANTSPSPGAASGTSEGSLTTPGTASISSLLGPRRHWPPCDSPPWAWLKAITGRRILSIYLIFRGFCDPLGC